METKQFKFQFIPFFLSFIVGIIYIYIVNNSKEKIVKTGNPVRSSLLSIHTKDKIFDGNKLFHLKQKTITILVLGGSLGARKINQLIEQNIVFFKEHQ